MSNEQPIKKSGLLIYLVLLTLFCFIGQIIVFVIHNFSYFHAALSAGQDFSVPATIWVALTIFWSWQILLNILFVLIVWSITRLSSQFLRLSWTATCNLGFALWMMMIILIFMANQLLYPPSSFSLMLSHVIPNILAKILLGITLTITTLFFLMALIRLIQIGWKWSHRLTTTILLIALFAIGVTYAINRYDHKPVIIPSSTDKPPNIFIISMDALRPDHIGYYGDKHNDTPELDTFLSQATNFRNSITPLARTYPAWVSILTGEDSKQNGARYNLQPIRQTVKMNSLSAILKNHGYDTTFAMSGRRFVSISHDFGFDHVVGPPLSINNFLIGEINDYPLSNLIVNTKIGKYLFPYSYGNRDAVITYQPSVFRREIEQNLLKIKHRPIFLAAHFDLSHWPLVWAEHPYDLNESIDQNYRSAVIEVQKQAMLLIDFLKKHQFLEKAIVFIISDHGNAQGLPNDRILKGANYIAGKNSHPNIFKLMNATNFDTPKLDTSYGHGTDVLSYSQYNNVLAIRTFGINPTNTPDMIDDIVSLSDIKPTVLKLLNIPDQNKKDQGQGQSLMPYLYHQKPTQLRKLFFIESGFTPKGVESDKISVFNIVFQGAKVFYIDPKTDHLVIKKEAAQQLMINNKQRALYTKHWVLALYPKANHRVITILVNRDSGHWTDDLNSKFAKTAPLYQLLNDLDRYYGDEITHRYPFCGNNSWKKLDFLTNHCPSATDNVNKKS